MCKQDTESVKVSPESVLSNRGNLKGTHWTRFLPEGLSPGEFISLHCHANTLHTGLWLQEASANKAAVAVVEYSSAKN